MLKSAVLLLVLVAQERDWKISAGLKDLPGDAKKPPSLLAEGTTDFPDGAILKVNLYFGPVNPGGEATRGLVQVRDGKFFHAFQIFGPRERNLAGTYSVRVAFDPNLQPVKLQSLPPRQADAKLEVGDALAWEKEQGAVRKQLEGEIRAILAIADEVQARFAEAKGKPDPKAWAALAEGWKSRFLAIERRAGGVAEYRHLGLIHIVDSGLEQLREITLNLVDCGAKGLGTAMQEGRTVLDRAAREMLNEVVVSRLSPAELRGLLGEARAVLQGAPALSGDALAAARKRYVALTFSLGKHLGDNHRDSVGALADGGKRLFDALDEKKADDAKAAQAELLQRTEKILEALRDPK